MKRPNLEAGDVRFVMLFHDHDLSIPVIQTLVYERSVSIKEGKLRFLFREIGASKDEELFFVDEDDFEQLVLDIDQLSDKIVKLKIEQSKV